MSQAQREAYVAPTTTTTFDTAGGSNFAATSLEPVTQYICGECSTKVQLQKGDQIRCKDCGHRILYKERTKRMVQFEAR
ncbi:DNA-directed RNA polymerase core subunit rpc10 [Thelotrema lepadinum]|nr:DNA-directed RNA polymerase core subunit rpc10 [Thelotrema lepadinum]